MSGLLLLFVRNKEFLRLLFQSIAGGRIDQDTVPETTEFPLVFISASWDPGKEWTATGETSLGPNTAGLSWWTMPGVSVYHASSWSMSNWKRSLSGSVQFRMLAAGCDCRVIGSTNWIWFSYSIGIRSKKWFIAWSCEWTSGHWYSQAKLPSVSRDIDGFSVSIYPARRGFSRDNIKIVKLCVRFCSHWFFKCSNQMLELIVSSGRKYRPILIRCAFHSPYSDTCLYHLFSGKCVSDHMHWVGYIRSSQWVLCTVRVE